MAHHNSTPAAVLAAPKSVPTVISEQKGYSRSERRHGSYAPPKMTTEARTAAHVGALAAGRNQPLVSKRVRPIRKGRKARFNQAVSA